MSLAVAQPVLFDLEPSLFEDERVTAEDDQPVLQAMFDYAEANPAPGRSIDLRGRVWEVGSTLHLKADHATVYMSQIDPLPNVEIGDVLRIDAAGAAFVGLVRVTGDGGDVYANRDATNGVVLGNVRRTTFDGFLVKNMRRHCVTTEGWGGTNSVIDASLGSIEGINCGSAANIAGTHVSKLELQATSVTRAGVGTSVVALDVLTVDLSQHLGHFKVQDLVFLGDSLHIVRGLDESANTLSVFPWVPHLSPEVGVPTPIDETVTFSHGAALRVVGGNTTGLHTGRVGVMRAGIGYSAEGLYGGDSDGVTTEAVGVGLRVGADTGAAHLGGHFGQLHFEQTKLHIVQINRPVTPWMASSFVVFDPEKFLGMTTSVPTVRWGMLEGAVLVNGVPYMHDHVQFPNNTVTSIPVFSNRRTQSRGSVVKNNPTVTLDWDPDHNRLWGDDSLAVKVYGTDGGCPCTVTLQLDPSDAGWTINGSTSDLVLTLSKPGTIHALGRVAQQDWRVDFAPFE